MGDGLDDAPSWVEPFHDALIERAFALIREQRYDQPFGNYVAQFARGDFRIQYVKDRGDWSINLWDATHPLNVVGQPLQTSISMVRAVQDGIQDEIEAVRYTVEDDANWMVEHLDETEQLVTERSTWVLLNRFGKQYRQRIFGT